MQNILKKLVGFLGSFGLAATLLVMLTVLTLFGTLEQQFSTLHDVKKEYFESFFVVHDWAGKYPIPWPGAMLLLPLLALNLITGGLLRLRMGRSTVGVFIVHVGIVVLLVGSLIEHSFSTKGHLTVLEGESSNEYVSYHDWEVVVGERRPDGSVREYVIPHSVVSATRDGGRTRIQNPDLPFDLVLSDYLRNSRPAPVEDGVSGDDVVDGWRLEEREPISKADEDERRMNVGGAYALIVEKAGSRTHRGILWAGRPEAPFGVEIGGTAWTVGMRRLRWAMPFTIRLDRFVHEKHPGTGMDRRFSSYVTQTQGAAQREVHITMNEPLRNEGYTLYQSGWGRDGGRYVSTFSVVANPSDKVPLIACIIIALGMLIHFIRKLVNFLKAQSRRAAHARREIAAGSAS